MQPAEATATPKRSSVSAIPLIANYACNESGTPFIR